MQNNHISDIVSITADLSELGILIEFLKDDEIILDLPVKSRNKEIAILPYLKRCHKLLVKIDPTDSIFPIFHNDLDDCIDFFDENYSIKSKWKKTPENLRQRDLIAANEYFSKLLGNLEYESEKLSLKPIEKKLHTAPAILTKNLDKSSNADLKEGIKSLDFGLTTGSFMLFCRVAEKIATSYYEKFIQTTSNHKSWNDMYHEIKNKQEHEHKIRRSILALFDFLREKRNQAQHPGKRFTKKDCQKLLNYLEDFQEEISSHKFKTESKNLK